MGSVLRPVLRVPEQRDRDEEVGDRAFLDALHEHLDRLHDLARGLTRSAQDAEDLLQETCLLALRGWRRERPDEPGAWLAAVCLNASRSSHRKRDARPREVAADDRLLDRPDQDADTAAQALAGLDARRVRDALDRLPALQREAITLMDLGGYTAAQVAGITGSPRGTVLARVHRGRKALAALLDDREVGGGARP